MSKAWKWRPLTKLFLNNWGQKQLILTITYQPRKLFRLTISLRFDVEYVDFPSSLLLHHSEIGDSEAHTENLCAKLKQVQRHMQLHIEAQGKYLQAVLEKAQETLGRHDLGSVGLEAAKNQLSELVSKVSADSLSSAFPNSMDLHLHQLQTNQNTDCSLDSCLTCERPQKDRKIVVDGSRSRDHHPNPFLLSSDIADDRRSRQTAREDAEARVKRAICDLSTNCGHRSSSEGTNRRMDEEIKLTSPRRTGDRETDSTEAEQREGPSLDRGRSRLRSKLDLNARDEGRDASSRREPLDLNGFSWSWEAGAQRRACATRTTRVRTAEFRRSCLRSGVRARGGHLSTS